MIASPWERVPRLTPAAAKSAQDLVALSTSRRRGSGENRLTSSPGSPTCWSIHCTSTSPLCVCAIRAGAAVEIAREAHGKHSRNGCSASRRQRRLSRTEIVATLALARSNARYVIPVGVAAEGGLVAGGVYQAGFPTEIDQLLLSVAANHAATAFRTARVEEAIRESEEQLRKSP